MLGRKFGGDVVEMGAKVHTFKPDMHVNANLKISRGDCFYCKIGQENFYNNFFCNLGVFAKYLI